ncbi:MAG: T9SS type A sorting domain-containing protein [Flavobacteriales bacterium]
MIRTTTLFLLLVSATGAAAQCTSAVPSGSTIIDDSSPVQITGTGQNYWVCSDAFQKIFTGGNNNIWIESGAFVSINSGGNTIRYKGNFLGIFGSNNTIYAQSAGSISDQGSGNTVTPCGTGAVVFTYGSAPNPGCSGVGLAEQAIADLRIHPNPVQDMLVISGGGASIKEVRICDLSGREVSAHTGDQLQSIPVAHLAKGTYLVRIVTDRGTLLHRMNKS